MEKYKLEEILTGNISLINKVNERDIALYEVRVPVTPEIVKSMLLKF